MQLIKTALLIAILPISANANCVVSMAKTQISVYGSAGETLYSSNSYAQEVVDALHHKFYSAIPDASPAAKYAAHRIGVGIAAGKQEGGFGMYPYYEAAVSFELDGIKQTRLVTGFTPKRVLENAFETLEKLIVPCDGK